ncbi:MAG: hypothetical protein KatS3mg102_1971 [Planctomycetota bacterium]|nr:MAG: hypothetical protein KatS3mg102_1971 [Planctomycetota bacterium]
MQPAHPSHGLGLGLDGPATSAELPLLVLTDAPLFPCALRPVDLTQPESQAALAACAGTPEQDRLLIAVLAQPAWVDGVLGGGAVHRIGCLAKVLSSGPWLEGELGAVLCGVRRVRLREVGWGDGMWRGTGEPADELLPPGGAARAERLRQRLLALVAELPRCLLRHQRLLEALRRLDAPLGATADLIADSLRLPAAIKQSLLAELCPLRRAQLLLERLRDELLVVRGALGRSAMPRLSAN